MSHRATNENVGTHNPIASIIVPVHNTADYLPQCIESAQSQSLRDIEIIFIDDGSSDDSVTIIENAAANDPRITLLKQDHRGAGAARNRGIEAARGTYLLFLDSDDWIEQDMLSTLVADAQQYDSDIVVSGAYEFNENKGAEWLAKWMYQYEALPASPFNWHDIPDRIFTGFPSLVWNKLFSREFVEREHLRFQEIPRSNDVYFMGVAALAAERISAVEGAYIHHRLSNPNSCQATKDAYPQGFLEARIALRNELIRRGAYGDEGEQLAVKTDFLNQSLKTLMHMLSSFHSKDSFSVVCDLLFSGPEGSSVLGFEELEDEAYRRDDHLTMYKALAGAEPNMRLFDWAQSLYQVSFKQYKQLQNQEIKIQRRDERIEKLLSSHDYRIGHSALRVPRAVRRRINP